MSLDACALDFGQCTFARSVEQKVVARPIVVITTASFLHAIYFMVFLLEYNAYKPHTRNSDCDVDER